MRLRAAADPRIDPVAPVAEPGLQNVFVPQRSASRFGQITTSLERLLALIRPVLDFAGACDASPRAPSFRRRDRLCDGRVDVRGAHVIFARARQA